MRLNLLTCLIWMAFDSRAFCQQLVIQQPVVGTTSASTSVVVPNGGRAFLGGVSSTQSGRSRYGFAQPGSSIGLSRSSSSMSVGVTIIDLREMDEAILNSVPDQPESSTTFTRHANAVRSSRANRLHEPVRETPSTAERASLFERLARKAELENRPGAAKLHWQMAAKYGSAIAREQSIASSR